MIISKQKPLTDILNAIGDGPVFIIGCSECATLCQTGGETEVLALKKMLENKNILVTGWIVLDPACHLNNSKRLLKSHKQEIEKACKLLVLACGNGVQTVADLYEKKTIISGTDTLFLGQIKRTTSYEKKCTMCGECLLDLFAGTCPISLCPKSMLNGPCGGAKNGKCEIDTELPCIWDIIYQRLKEKDNLEIFQIIQQPKDWSKSHEMRRSF